MNVLVDVVHPAHVHFYRHVISTLSARGHRVHAVGRQKDVTVSLLERFDIPHEVVRRPPGSSRAAKAAELVTRDLAIARIARRFRADVILTRNPSGVHAARLSRAIGVFDTDDGRAAGAHFWTAALAAHVITSPECLGEDLGRRHRTYPGFKALAYLHPDRFRPDASVRHELGLARGEQFALVRFVAMDASHDHSESGIPAADKVRLVRTIAGRVRVFASSEGPLPPGLPADVFPLPPERMHDALAEAALYVGDSQTMAAEAALLGTPALRATSWAGRLRCVEVLEDGYGLLQSFPSHETDALIAAAGAILDDRRAKVTSRERRDLMLAEVVDVSDWYADLVEEIYRASASGAR